MRPKRRHGRSQDVYLVEYDNLMIKWPSLKFDASGEVSVHKFSLQIVVEVRR